MLQAIGVLEDAEAGYGLHHGPDHKSLNASPFCLLFRGAPAGKLVQVRLNKCPCPSEYALFLTFNGVVGSFGGRWLS